MRFVGPIVQTLGDLGSTARGLARTREVASVLARHGFGALVRDVPGYESAAGGPGTPERLVAALVELGPTWVKLGQVLSTRPDLLPGPWILALSRLQDDVSALAPAEVDAALCAELGAGWRSRFERFDDAPLATASIAQVHAARVGGAEVVVKVQRPGLPAVVEADLLVLGFLARRAVAEWPDLRAADPGGLLREFERTMRAELDFGREAENLRRFGRQFAGHDWLVVPAVHDALVTPRVLVVERLAGVPIRRAREAGHDMAVVGRRYLDAVFEMILGHGFFHGDMHPGNVFVLPGDRLGLIDFGMVGTLTDAMRAELVTLIFALQRRDHRTLARVLHDIAIKDERLDPRALERATIEVVEAHFPAGAQLRDIEMGAFSMELVSRSARLGARVPTSYMMVLKALVTAEGLAKTLFEEADPIAIAAPWFARVAAERVAPERLQMEGLYALVTLSSLLERVPLSLTQLLDDLDAQRLTIAVRAESDPVDRARADARAGRYVAAGLSVGAGVVGALVVDVWPVATGGAWLLAASLGVAAWFGLAPAGRGS